MVAKMLHRPALVLNRNWQPVNVATVARALVMLWNEAARIVDPHDYQLYDWADWSRLAPREGEPFVQAVSRRLRVPEVVVLSGYDRLPEAAVAFSRRNIFKRDHYACQYCGVQPGRRRVVDRPRLPAVARRRVELGELRAGLPGVQQSQGRPHSGPGRHEAPQAAGPSAVEAAVRGSPRPDRKLVEVRQRGVLERRAEVNVR